MHSKHLALNLKECPQSIFLHNIVLTAISVENDNFPTTQLFENSITTIL